ncbi:MAG: glycerol-3-phosphate dehydrogenase/oxidase [Actinomycetota bacterium]|nr:glycerol-3-phosphate dehydrogenase/oxidase [Actinomycetota bacterium]
MAPDFDREAALRRLAGEEFDLLVVGGGVTGCGVALDAASRGLRTALVEAADFAHGTSSKSSKLIHGGLRYLQQHDYLLVYEALHERQRLIRNAPHLVHPLPFLIPLFGRNGMVAKGVTQAYSTALWLYDATGGVRIGHRHQRIDADEALAHFPGLRTDRLVASFLYWDAQADDARLTLALARTASAHGAAVANYAPVDAFLQAGGRVCGVRLRDGTEVGARVVVNAGGVWSEQIGRLGPAHDDGISIRPAKGIHITVPADRLPCDYASVLSVPGDRRSVFVVPWAADEATGPAGRARYTYVGTTDTDYQGSLDEPRCTAEDVAYLLGAVNAWTGASLTPDDISGSWAGLRPLISDARSARTADLSRRHRVVVGGDGLVTVTGGKLTTYRQMAADTVDAALGAPIQPWLRRLPGAGGRRGPPSVSARLVLVGGEHGGRPAPGTAERARRLGLDPAGFSHLCGRHGHEAADVLDMCEGRTELARRLHPDLPYIEAEVVWAGRREMARTVTDVLARRTRALILDRAAARSVAGRVAELLGPVIGLNPQQRMAQVADFERLVDAETAAEAPAGPRNALAP